MQYWGIILVILLMLFSGCVVQNNELVYSCFPSGVHVASQDDCPNIEFKLNFPKSIKLIDILEKVNNGEDPGNQSFNGKIIVHNRGKFDVVFTKYSLVAEENGGDIFFTRPATIESDLLIRAGETKEIEVTFYSIGVITNKFLDDPSATFSLPYQINLWYEWSEIKKNQPINGLAQNYNQATNDKITEKHTDYVTLSDAINYSLDENEIGLKISDAKKYIDYGVTEFDFDLSSKFMTSKDISADFNCVTAIGSLNSTNGKIIEEDSGTIGKAKLLYLRAEDSELTITTAFYGGSYGVGNVILDGSITGTKIIAMKHNGKAVFRMYLRNNSNKKIPVACDVMINSEVPKQQTQRKFTIVLD